MVALLGAAADTLLTALVGERTRIVFLMTNELIDFKNMHDPSSESSANVQRDQIHRTNERFEKMRAICLRSVFISLSLRWIRQSVVHNIIERTNSAAPSQCTYILCIQAGQPNRMP